MAQGGPGNALVVRNEEGLGQRDQKARGRFPGGTRPPFGFRAGDDGSLVPDEARRAAIASAKRTRGRGRHLRYIAAKLLTR